MIILGLNAFHADSAAALVRDGELVSAAEEERFRRIKHWAGFPSRSIEYCLREARIDLADVDHIAVNQDSRAHLWRKIAYGVEHAPSWRLVWKRLRYRHRRQCLKSLLDEHVPLGAFKGAVHNIEHHLCHLLSAYFVSPFKDAAVLSVDGFGDFSSAAWGAGQNGAISVLGRVYFPHSLGVFYQALTQYLGFPHYGDEYKVMGLAPYGRPDDLAKLREVLHLKMDGTFELNLRFFRHHVEDVPYQWESGSPDVGDIFSSALEELLGPRRLPGDPLEDRHRNIASAVQSMYEDAFFNLVDVIEASTGASDLALAGGCAANSVANGKVRRRTQFRRVYVHPAAGDAGGAIGAAFAVWARLGGQRRFVMDHAFWGPTFSDDDVTRLVRSRGDELDASGCVVEEVRDEDQLCQQTASAVAAGEVVGWFQGRMEWGPRALGNRSIVCDPRRSDMKSILNQKIKRRESFRPFAPAVLDEAVADWFEEDDAVPFMMQVFQIRKDKRALVPAVTHVDGSGRLQTVNRHTNPRFYRLIEYFRDETSIPMVLNTSFNENEPVVCEPKEALECFLRTKMDRLVLGTLTIRRGTETIESEAA